jgi:hypothetical protein
MDIKEAFQEIFKPIKLQYHYSYGLMRWLRIKLKDADVEHCGHVSEISSEVTTIADGVYSSFVRINGTMHEIIVRPRYDKT